jgi:two-component system, sporulation sensor kinase E
LHDCNQIEIGMAKNIYRFKGIFKSFLFVFAVVITLGFSIYIYIFVDHLQQQTRSLIKDMQNQSREFLNFRVRVFEESINNETSQDLNFFFDEVIQQADYPIIYTDANKIPQYWRNISIAESETSTTLSRQDTMEYLKKMVQNYEEMNPPIPISYKSQILGYYVYGESPLIAQLRFVESEIVSQLRWLLIIEITVVALFVLIGYAGFHSIKKSEERYIWVGMAKETAHQLGTPLSSLIGWIEYLKSTPRKLGKVIPDLERDMARLQIITNRFSLIGSVPDLTPETLRDVICDTVDYFRKRLPQKNGKIQIETQFADEIPLVLVNKDLFSWVLENLIKNALDAVGDKKGKISLQENRLNDSQIYIDIQDSGKGISGKSKKNIFKPGFSTKKRGWGLGLSLAKRIVEDYHGGKLILKESQINGGSTFRIILNIYKD